MQVCTGVMTHGPPLVKQLCGELQAFQPEASSEDRRACRCARGS